MSKYLLRRLIQTIPTLLGISIVVFLSLRLIPGDPCRRIHGIKASAETIQNCRARLKLDDPIWQQYGSYLQQLSRGDLGVSYLYRKPAIALVAERLPVTGALALMSMVFAVMIALPLGILAAMKQGSWMDHGIRGLSTSSLAFPHFLIALGLMLVFSIHLRLFPISGYGDGLLEHIHHLTLPALTLALATAALLARGLRNSLLESLGKPYTTTAYGKGASRQRVFTRHAIPNALIPFVSLLGLNLVIIFGATVIVEQVFALPGLGSLMVSSIFNRDYEVVQSITLVFAVLVVMVNLLTDVSYAVVDPRIRYE